MQSVKKYAAIEAKLATFVTREFFLEEESFPAGSFGVSARNFPISDETRAILAYFYSGRTSRVRFDVLC